jgi:hypothetical protein
MFSAVDGMMRWPLASPLPSSLAQLRIDDACFIIRNGCLHSIFGLSPPRRMSNARSVFFANSSFF